MTVDVRKVGAGLALLVASSVILVASGEASATVPLALTAVAAVGLAAGSLLVGTAGEGRPV